MQEQFPEKRKRGRPRNTSPKPAGNTVLALDRGLVILEALAKLGSATLSQLALQVDMPASTIHRILATLQNHSFADLDKSTQTWAVGVGAFRVGSTFLTRSNLIEASHAVLRDLMEQTGETSNLAIAEAGHVIFVSQVESPNPIRAMFRQGTGSPMHASGIGKAMLAEMQRETCLAIVTKTGQPAFTPLTLTTPAELLKDLDKISQSGWALDNEERYLGMRCIAAAIYDDRGNAIAGLSVSGPIARFTNQMIFETAPIVIKAAHLLSERTGGRPPKQSVS